MGYSVYKTLQFQTDFIGDNKRRRSEVRRDKAENSPNQNNIFHLLPINLPSIHTLSLPVWVEEAVIKSTVGR